MNQIANMLKARGIKRGDCVAFYVHASFYAVAASFACARIGVVYTCIYAEFPVHAIASQINETECVAVITDNQGLRRGHTIEFKTIIDLAIKDCPTVKHTFVIDRTDLSYETNDKVINLRQVRI
jgi:acetyl-CoA synthetase